ncbi:MAG: hypothetical protein NTW86_16170 [Candidatus Sumerlaeota bacterium]|nr:hypothetical protein [Candidatus Sumerlaeota bacterium]
MKSRFRPNGPPANRALTLRALLPDLLAEMGSVSFFPGMPRVAIVNELSDFWAAEKDEDAKPAAALAKGKNAGAAKALSPVDRFIRYFETDFASTGNAIVFTVFEDPDKRRVVDKRRKLVAWIKEHGRLISFEGRPIAFELGDALMERNLPKALGLFREGYKKGRPEQAMALFYVVLRQVHFLLQAKIASAATRQQLTDDFIAAELLPGDSKSTNLFLMHRFPRGKYEKAAGYFSVSELTKALQDLYEINRFLMPRGDDPYVGDAGYLMERLIVRLCARNV